MNVMITVVPCNKRDHATIVTHLGDINKPEYSVTNTDVWAISMQHMVDGVREHLADDVELIAVDIHNQPIGNPVQTLSEKLIEYYNATCYINNRI